MDECAWDVGSKASIREMADGGHAARQEQLLQMFDRAAADVNAEDYDERERLLNAFAHRD